MVGSKSLKLISMIYYDLILIFTSLVGPSPRYDAALCACGSNILLYGGYGTSSYNRNTSMDRRDLTDMYILDTSKLFWDLESFCIKPTNADASIL